jgi:Zn-finger nucleic acid-binding protein
VNKVLPAHRSRKCSAKRSRPADLVLATNLQNPDVCGTVDWKSIVPIYSRDIHPANEDLEELHFGRISTQQRQNIESHIHHCDRCRGAVADLREFVELLSHAIEWRNGMLQQQVPQKSLRTRTSKAARPNDHPVRKSKASVTESRQHSDIK